MGLVVGASWNNYIQNVTRTETEPKDRGRWLTRLTQVGLSFLWSMCFLPEEAGALRSKVSAFLIPCEVLCKKQKQKQKHLLGDSQVHMWKV